MACAWKYLDVPRRPGYEAMVLEDIFSGRVWVHYRRLKWWERVVQWWTGGGG